MQVRDQSHLEFGEYSDIKAINVKCQYFIVITTLFLSPPWIYSRVNKIHNACLTTQQNLRPIALCDSADQGTILKSLKRIGCLD